MSISKNRIKELQQQYKIETSDTWRDKITGEENSLVEYWDYCTLSAEQLRIKREAKLEQKQLIRKMIVQRCKDELKKRSEK